MGIVFNTYEGSIRSVKRCPLVMGIAFDTRECWGNVLYGVAPPICDGYDFSYPCGWGIKAESGKLLADNVKEAPANARTSKRDSPIHIEQSRV